MKKIKLIAFLVFILTFFTSLSWAEDGAGVHGVFTRGGWVGAKYVALGATGGVLADDVFAIYWNPAGLSNIIGKSRVTLDEIKKKAANGNASDISEEELLNFSEDDKKVVSIDFGASVANLDAQRQAGFSGVAFDAFGGILGFGAYTIVSTDIQGYDVSGNPTGNMNYVSGEGIISYGTAYDILSFGFSLKGYYESIAGETYGGVGSDIGIQVFVLPFIKVGVVFQDVVGAMVPTDSGEENFVSTVDLMTPSIKAGVAVVTDASITISFNFEKRLEQDDLHYGIGFDYELTKSTNLYMGLSDSNITTGISVEVYGMQVSYAFAVDNIDYGYNSIVSLERVF